MEVFAARVGLTARGIVYILMGFLAFLIAGGSHAEVDQKSALDQVLLRPGGRLLVGLMAVGFACYALWRFFEAASGVTGENEGMGSRMISFVRGLVYSSFAITAVSVFNGSHQHQSTQQRRYAFDVMSHQGGRLVVGVLGLVIVAVGINGLNEGMKFKFMRYFQGEHLSHVERRWIRSLGRIGITSRGIVFVITGILLIFAAWTHNATKATGLDGALKTLRNQPFGGFLLGVVAIGLVIFGIYGLAEARYRHI
jgi:hypothetical protein